MRSTTNKAMSTMWNRVEKASRPVCQAARVLGLGLVIIASIGWTAGELRAGSFGQTAPAASRESLDSILEDLATYDFAVGVGAPMRLKAYVLAHKDDPADRRETETKLLAFLESGATPGGKMEACRSLRLVGSAAAVPVLGKLLLVSGTTDMARYALERIPGPEAERALLAALEKTRGSVKLGIVFSLGERSAASVPALDRLARARDREAASAAVKALGRIGGEEASNALQDMLQRSVSDPLKSEVLSALLVVAEGFLRDGAKAKAAAVYDRVLASRPSPVLRRAAFKGKIAAAESDAGGLILGALSGKDPALHEPAIAMIPETFGAEEIGRITPFLSALPEAAQIQLLAVLAGFPPGRVAGEIAALCESPSAEVRAEALRSLGRAGDASVVGLLSNRAATAKGLEQTTAREALWRLKGADVDAAVLKLLAGAESESLRSELIQAVGERRISGAEPVLVETVKSGPAAVRSRAIRALQAVSSQADIGTLLELLFTLELEAERESMQNAIAAVARANPREQARGNEAEALLARETDPRKKADLLRVLGKIGDDTALPLVRAALEDSTPSVADAAVRALADWPTNASRDDLIGIAQKTTELNHKVLAVRAYVRMVGLEPYRAPEGVVEDMFKVLALDPRPEEKRLVLGLLARYPCVASLKVAESLIPDESVRKEATLAADRIREALTQKK